MPGRSPKWFNTATPGLVARFRYGALWSNSPNAWGTYPTVNGLVKPATGIQPAADGTYTALHFTAANSSFLDYGGIGSQKAITFCAWIKLDSLPSAGNYYAVGLLRPTMLGYVKDTGKLALYTGPAGGQAYDPGTITLTTGRWYHVAFSYSNAAGGAGYVDGVLDSTTVSGGDLGAATNFQIGNDAINRYFDGIIDDLRFYNIALSQAEILKIRAEAFQPVKDIETIALQANLQAGVISPDDFSRRRRVVFRGPRRGPLTGRQYVEVPLTVNANAVLTQDNATLIGGAETTPVGDHIRRRPWRVRPFQGPLAGRGYTEISSPVQANAIVTQADAALSAAATLAISATASLTQANQTLSGAATVAIAATASLTQANQTLSAAAVLPISGTATLTQAAQTLSAATTLIVGGTASLTQADQSLSATATTVSGSINASAALVQDDFALVAQALAGGALPPLGIGGKPQGWRSDLGPHWRYRPLKKRKDIRQELEKLEEVCEQIAVDSPEEAQPDELVERCHRLIEAIETATEKVKAETAKRAYDAMQARAIEVRRKLAEEEEEQAAWLLLHLL